MRFVSPVTMDFCDVELRCHFGIFQKFCTDSKTSFELEEEGDILVITHIIGEVTYGR